MWEVSYKQIEKILYNYKLIKSSIDNNKLILENLEVVDGVKAITHGEVSSKTNKFNSIVENATIDNIERKEKLEKKIATDELTIKLIDNTLKALPEVERKILEMFYIENIDWWKVALEVAYSEGWCKEKRRSAINKIVSFLVGGQS